MTKYKNIDSFGFALILFYKQINIIRKNDSISVISIEISIVFHIYAPFFYLLKFSYYFIQGHILIYLSTEKGH